VPHGASTPLIWLLHASLKVSVDLAAECRSTLPGHSSLSESLAGRSAVVDVRPFSQGEFEGRFETFIDMAFDDPDALREFAPSQVDRAGYFDRICRGRFPE
jgi:hypothetical protein